MITKGKIPELIKTQNFFCGIFFGSFEPLRWSESIDGGFPLVGFLRFRGIDFCLEAVLLTVLNSCEFGIH
jgi:hypothetical protein